MEEKLIKKMDDAITKILNEGLNTNNLDTLYKLSKIRHLTKEDEQMNYGNYGNYDRSYNDYGRGAGYDAYGRRGYDMRYKGHDDLDRMSEHYGRYQENRMRYGANSEDSKRSLKYMLESMEHFAKMLKEDAQSQEEVMMIKETAQRIAQM